MLLIDRNENLNTGPLYKLNKIRLQKLIKEGRVLNHIMYGQGCVLSTGQIFVVVDFE